MVFKRILVLILTAHAVTGDAELMEELKTFCGENITVFLQKLCKEYYTPEYRVKRGIANDCCEKTCSTYHLLSNYCANYDRDEVIRYLKEQKMKNFNRINQQLKVSKRRRRRSSRRAK